MRSRGSHSNLLLVLVLLLVASMPLKRSLYSLGFKLEGIFLLLAVLLVFFRSSIDQIASFFKSNLSLAVVFFMFPFVFTVFGILHGWSVYYATKEFFFFFSPLLIFFVLDNIDAGVLPLSLDRLIVYLGILISFILVLFELKGLFLAHYSWRMTCPSRLRYVYRNEYVFLCISFIGLAFVLAFDSLLRSDNLLLVLGNFVLMFSITLTMGRAEVALLLFFLSFFLFEEIFGFSRVFRLYTILTIISPLVYMLFLLGTGLTKFDYSIQWRLFEWVSYFYSFKHGSANLLLGEGFGYMLTTLYPLKLYSGKILCQIDRFHNLFLFLLVKSGVLGLSLFYIGMIYILIKRYVRCMGESKRTAGILVLYIMFKMFVEGNVTGSITMNLSEGLTLGICFALLSNLMNNPGDVTRKEGRREITCE